MLKKTSHFLLHCPIYSNVQSLLLVIIRNIDCKLLENTETSLTQAVLYGNTYLDINTNSLILNATIDFILSTKRFEGALFKRNNHQYFFFCFVS